MSVDEPAQPALFGRPAQGPWHWFNESWGGNVGWCGAREQFRHVRRRGTADDVTCTKCKAAIKQGKPRAWRY